MAEIYGDFIEELSKKEVEYLMIGFSPNSVPLKQRWRTNGLSADFIADYLQTFFVGSDTDNRNDSAPIPVQSKNAVKYIANELLENAMKFHDESAQLQTKIVFHLCCQKLIFQVNNTVNLENAEKFKEFIHKLLQSDPQELYIQQMEANAREDSTGHSGLGFLSMVCDYSAHLGWKFEEIKRDPVLYQVTTMVILDV